jgi:hypothetical protein
MKLNFAILPQNVSNAAETTSAVNARMQDLQNVTNICELQRM